MKEKINLSKSRIFRITDISLSDYSFSSSSSSSLVVVLVQFHKSLDFILIQI